jgi:hypothetical protein
VLLNAVIGNWPIAGQLTGGTFLANERLNLDRGYRESSGSDKMEIDAATLALGVVIPFRFWR